MSRFQYLIILVPLMVALLGYDGIVLASRHFSASGTGAVQTGMASWYGREEQGKPTANGERYDRHGLTAAHRHLAFNTLVRVTNRENGRSVEVRINDRGPFRRGRILDLSEAAADTLDMKRDGVVPVKIEVIQPGPDVSTGKTAAR